MTRTLWTAALALPVFLLAGCSQSGGDAAPTPSTVTVKGKVLLPGGQPATGGVVLFEPVEGGTEAYGLLNKDGTFTIKTFGGTQDGAVPGKYKVAVTPNHHHPELTKAAAEEGRRSIPKKYWKADTTDLTADVTSSTGELTFRLK
jgi:hypothetical protein